MIEAGDGSFARRLEQGRCPKCDTHLPSVDADWKIFGYIDWGDPTETVSYKLQCNSCKLEISVEPCTYKDKLGSCRDGMIREPDGEGCVQWTTCWSCRGRGWT